MQDRWLLDDALPSPRRSASVSIHQRGASQTIWPLVKARTMADTPLFELDAERRWRLAVDQHQWIVQKRTGRARLGHSGTRDSGFRGVYYIGSTKRLLESYFGRKQIELTDEAHCRFQALPPTFIEFWGELHEPDQGQGLDDDLFEAAQ